jgi:hypothetical protein
MAQIDHLIAAPDERLHPGDGPDRIRRTRSEGQS